MTSVVDHPGQPSRASTLDRAYNLVLERVALPVGDLVLRTEFMKSLRMWRRIQTLSADELRSLQSANLSDLLGHATTRVPYYRDLAIESDADPHVWLSRFPILTKTELRTEADRLRTPGTQDLVEVSSSGSSGIQSTVWLTPREISRSQAIQTLWWEWAGYRLGHRLLQTGMTPDRGVVKQIKDRALRTTYVVAFGLTSDEMATILQAGERRPWAHLGGYASNLDAFARAAKAHGIDIEFDSVISWGDKLFDQYRSTLESTFSTSVHDTYGTTEGMYIAAQCNSSEYYVMSPHVVVELLDEDWRPVEAGTMGRVVVTRLDTRAMPLVRYYLGDLAMAPAEPVQRPGRPAFPQLERIIGRDTDVVVTPGGRVLTVHTFTGVFEFAREIEQFSIIPGRGGIEVEYIARDGFEPAVLDAVTGRLHTVIGEELAITWTEVDRIPDSPSGKPQIIRPSRGGPARA